MDLGLTGRVAVITGPAKSMGSTISLAFAGEGCRLALLARDLAAVAPVEPEGRRERSWRDLERHYLAQRTSRDVGHLDHTIHTAVHNLNHERATPMGASFPRAA